MQQIVNELKQLLVDWHAEGMTEIGVELAIEDIIEKYDEDKDTVSGLSSVQLYHI